MKKQILFVAALTLVFASCENNTAVTDPFVATFEEASICPKEVNSEFKLDTTGVFQSGNFILKQDARPSAAYYSCNVVSNHTDTNFKDWNDAWKSAVGGAHAGKNYVVWNLDFYGLDTIKLKQPATVPGFYVTNSIYAYESITKGDAYEKPFAQGDWFLLTIVGVKNNKPTGKVDFYLAKDTEVVKDWTYVDLSKLGEIDGLIFGLTGSRTSYGYLNTPAYFAFDDLGAKR